MLEAWFSFSGRMSRRAFWVKFNAFYVAAFFVLRFATLQNRHTGELLQLACYVLLLWPHLATLTKRLHDRGRPIWYFLALYLTSNALFAADGYFPGTKPLLSIGGMLLGTIITIEANFMPGEDTDNRFGPDPLADQHWGGLPGSLPLGDMRRRQSGAPAVTSE